MTRTRLAPKWLESFFAFYPLMQGLLLAWISLIFVRRGGWAEALSLIFVAYLMSPMIWAAFSRFYPVPRISYLGRHAEGANAWWISYQLQQNYVSFPFFERILILIPGFYSAWLRLWGAKVGKKVNWTPECKIVDRPFIEIGDRVLVGNRSFIVSHVVMKKENKYRVFVERVKVGSDSVIAYLTTLAPGVEIGERAVVEAGATMYPLRRLEKGGVYVRYQELLESGKYPVQP